MTIIRQGVNKIGTAWSRKVNTQTIPDNGNGVIVHAQIFPPYVWPGQFWANWSVIDPSSDGVHPKLSAECNMYIQMGEIKDDVATSDYDTEAEVLQLANEFIPLDEVFLNESNPDGSTDVGVEFTGYGDAAIPPAYARTLVKRYNYSMGIGQNAYPTNANFIRYHFKGKYSGHLKTKEMLDIAKPRLLVIRANTQIPDNSGTESDGISGGLSMANLYDTLVDNIPGRNVDTVNVDAGNELNSNLHSYLNKGMSNDETLSNFFDSQELQVTNYCTTRLDIYEPAPRGHINPRHGAYE